MNKIIFIEIIEDKCDLCGCCVGVCPHDALELSEFKLSLIEESCTNCAKCVWSCPVEAIIFQKNKTTQEDVSV